MNGKPGHARVSVKCKIERSPFSDERIFTVSLPDGCEHIGTASFIYFTTGRNDKPLKEDEPKPKKSAPGFVESILIGEENGTWLVSFPDGSTASVAKEFVRASKEASPNVSFQS